MSDHELKELELFLQILAFGMIAIAGGMLNMAAVVTNGGRMPVKMNFDYSSNMHYSYQNISEVNYPMLTDYFNIGDLFFSIGDILLISGVLGVVVVWVILFIYKARRRTNENGN